MTNPTNNKIADLVISEDHLTATLQIHDFSMPPQDLLQYIKDLIRLKNIKFGMQFEALKTAILNKEKAAFVLARGIPTTPEGQPSFEKLIDFNPPRKRKTKVDGSVDHKEVIRANIVDKETPLIRIIPGNPAKSGVDVCGQKIDPSPEEYEPPVRLGINVSINPADTNLIFAQKPGLAVFTANGEINVLTTFIIEHDVNYDSGNIDFPGTVVIKGDVKSGFKVVAAEDIEIHGTVEDALIEAGRDIIMKHGFVGTMKGRAQAGRDINIAFAHHQALTAGRDIIFEVELMGCRVRAGRSLKSGGGRIVGGECEALEKISIKLAGSDEEVRTVLRAGHKSSLDEIKKKLEQQIKDYNDLISNNKKEIYNLVLEKVEKKMSPPDEQRLKKMQENTEILIQKIAEFEAELREVEEKIANLAKAFIQINGIIFPNVEIQLGGLSYRNKEKRRYVSFREMDDEIKVIRE